MISVELQELMSRGCRLLGSRYSVIGGAMTWISDANLVAAISNAGGFGVLACGAMSPDHLNDEIALTQSKTHDAFGVNILLSHPRIEELLDVCIEKKISHVILAGGVPSSSTINKLHSQGIQIFSFSSTLSLSKRLLRVGVDALILEGMEAGGHVGSVSTLVLVQDILLNLRGSPIFIAGGIGRGEVFASLLRLDAFGCQLGTLFAACKESRAHQFFKDVFFRSSARDTSVSMQIDERFKVIPVRAIANSASKEFVEYQRSVIKRYDQKEVTLEEGQLEIEHYWAGALKRAVVDGDVERGSLMAGQIVGNVHSEQSIEEIFAKFFAEADDFLAGDAID